MPILTLLTNNTFINPSFFQLVGMDQATVTARSATQITMTGGPSGGTYTLIGNGLTTVTVDGREYINGGTVQTIQFRLANSNFDVTNLNMSGFLLGNALLQDFTAFDQGAVERLFLGQNYVINGTSGNDTHFRSFATSTDGIALALTGANTYELAAGDDEVADPSTASDTIRGGSGNDRLSGGDGDDFLDGGEGNDTVFGGAGNDTLTTNDGADKLFGGADNDLLAMTANLVLVDVFDGGTGNDTLSLAGLTSDFGVDLSQQVLVLGGVVQIDVIEVENVIGGQAKDSIRGDDGANRLEGRGGDDEIDGGNGNDTLIGGAGVDQMTGGGGDDLVVMGANLQLLELFDGGDGIDTFSMAGVTEAMEADLAFPKVKSLTTTIEFFLPGFENLIGSSQNDRLFGFSDNNRLDGGAGSDLLEGLAGNDTLIGGQGADRLFGGNDNDLLVVGSSGISQGGEVYDGGLGTDTFSLEDVDFAGYRVNLGLQTADTMTGGFEVAVSGVENVIGSVDGDEITGSIGSNTLEGRQGGDTLIGGNGVDRLDGGTGADSMFGGAGDDFYLVDDTGDVVVESRNLLSDGVADEVSSSVSYSLNVGGAVFIERLRLTGTANLFAIGNDLDNHITGNDGDNMLDGLDGNDSLFGGAGDDAYVVDDALDVASEAVDGVTDAGGIDKVIAGFTYSLDGTDGRQFIENLTLSVSAADIDGAGNGLDNRIVGNDGANRLEGLDGNDTLFGGQGSDTLTGGVGTDELNGEGGDDTFDAQGDGFSDSSFGGVGNDRFLLSNTFFSGSFDGGDDSDTIDGSALVQFALTVDLGLGTYDDGGGFTFTLANTEHAIGGASGDSLTGSGGDNSLFGGAGDDTLNGGGGVDSLFGGAGSDTYVVNLAGDIIIEVAGGGTADSVQTSASFTLVADHDIERMSTTDAAGTGRINLTGNALAQVITGNAGRNRLDGGGGIDRVIGGLGNDTYVTDGGDRIVEFAGGGTDTVLSSVRFVLGAELENLTLTGVAAIGGTGNDLANVIIGNDGANLLNGRLGIDRLTGGAGADQFVFDTALSATNIDRITDFVVVDDRIRLDDAVFARISLGGLAATAFAANTTGLAADDTDRIIYETDTGRLFFDADGTGSGARVIFAIISANLAVTHADFFVF